MLAGPRVVLLFAVLRLSLLFVVVFFPVADALEAFLNRVLPFSIALPLYREITGVQTDGEIAKGHRLEGPVGV